MIFSILGVALAVPLIAVPASAGNEAAGGILVRAEDPSENIAIAGFTTDSALPGAGGSVLPSAPPVGANPAAISMAFSCGPMELKIDQAMIDLSAANALLLAQGKAPKLSSGGWSFISTYGPGGIGPGFPTDGSRPLLVSLSTEPAPVGGFAPEESVKAQASAFGGSCGITDNRTAPRDGLTVSYAMVSPTNYTESRYLSEEGKLNFVTSAVSEGSKTLERRVAPGGNWAKSDTLSYAIELRSDGFKSAPMHFTETRDGYNAMDLYRKPGGGGTTTFRLMDEKGSQTNAKRVLTPYTIDWDAQGRPQGMLTSSQAYYADVAEFNRFTGQSWDGVFPTEKDMDLRFPFTATPPQ